MTTLAALAFILIASGCTRPVKPNEKDILLGECICKNLGGLKSISKSETIFGADGSLSIHCIYGNVYYYDKVYYAGCEK